MIRRIHILGGSGSGTTTLGRVLSKKLGYMHLDTDRYIFTNMPPRKREFRTPQERNDLLIKDLKKNSSWVLSGTFHPWGNFLLEFIDLVVFLWIPHKTRMKRRIKRDVKLYGKEILDPDHFFYKSYKYFHDWAYSYDTGGFGRSKAQDEEWMRKLPCPLLRIEGDTKVDERLTLILQRIAQIEKHI